MPSGAQEWATLTQACITEQVTRVGPGLHPAGTTQEAPQSMPLNCPVKGGRGKVYRFTPGSHAPLGTCCPVGWQCPSPSRSHTPACLAGICMHPRPVCQSPRPQRAGS